MSAMYSNKPNMSTTTAMSDPEWSTYVMNLLKESTNLENDLIASRKWCDTTKQEYNALFIKYNDLLKQQGTTVNSAEINELKVDKVVPQLTILAVIW